MIKLLLPCAIGYVAALKIILAGLFFYLYVSCFNLNPFARIAGSLFICIQRIYDYMGTALSICNHSGLCPLTFVCL